ncbi:hypothetical protein FAZ15_03115 [Sphingobacterium olei]|uniref:Uncharacterized protein n=1 Tax=Sphingobacterium olei TaxID=2571155 RepID=A0A4V5MN41_9SPHI|nr:hypothetical protein [Sphingobacterium olei]TJZ63288.1 hypothetical protein FAZ15_03115 [Sphingobacterium olei]
MNNLGVNVKLNGDQITKAGFDNENFVLTAMVTFVHRKDGSNAFAFDVGGLDSEANKHVDWLNVKLNTTIN